MIIELNWIHFWLPRIWLGIYKSVLNPISWFLPLPNLSDKHWGKRWFILRNKLNIQKTKFMASGPITSWQIDWETMETVIDFIFLGSKITADGDCSHEIRRRLLLGRKAMTNLDSILKSRDFAKKGPSSQSYGFSSSHVWMWELDYKESWALKNWCFWTLVWENFGGLRVL